MNNGINKLDSVIKQLRQCKEILGVTLIDDKDSVSYLNNKIDSMITKLENGKNGIETNKQRMENVKTWK